LGPSGAGAGTTSSGMRVIVGKRSAAPRIGLRGLGAEGRFRGRSENDDGELSAVHRPAAAGGEGQEGAGPFSFDAHNAVFADGRGGGAEQVVQAHEVDLVLTRGFSFHSYRAAGAVVAGDRPRIPVVLVDAYDTLDRPRLAVTLVPARDFAAE